MNSGILFCSFRVCVCVFLFLFSLLACIVLGSNFVVENGFANQFEEVHRCSAYIYLRVPPLPTWDYVNLCKSSLIVERAA